MASFGDQYNYQIAFDASGDVQTVEAVQRVSRATRKAADDATAAAKQSAQAREQAARAQAATLGQFAIQMSTIADDIQYGARGIQNNISGIILALGGFTPAAALAAGASSILIGAFRKQIDAGLAAAGVLDSNLVKGMEKAEEKTKELTESVGVLERALDRQAAVTDRWAESLKDAAGLIDFTDVEVALEELARAAIPDTTARIEELEATIEDLDAKAAAAGRRFDVMAKTELDIFRKAAKSAQEVLDELRKGLDDQANKAVAGFRAELDKGGDAARRVIDRIASLRGENDRLVQALRDAALGTKRLKEEQDDFADAILEGERAVQKRRQAIEDESDAFADAIKAEMEGQEQRARAAEDAARREINALNAVRQAGRAQRLDERSQSVANAFRGALGPDIERQLRHEVASGAPVDEAIELVRTRVFERMRGTGVEAQSADRAARALVEELAVMIREQSNALEATLRLGILNARQGGRNARRAAAAARQLYRMQILQGNNLRGAW